MNANLPIGMAMAVLMAASVLGSGCRSVNTVERKDPVGEAQKVDDKQVITDASLRDAVHVAEVRESEAPGGFLVVQLELVNKTRLAKRFTYQFTWIDTKGIVVDRSQAVHEKIAGGERLSIKEVAPTPQAKNFRVNLLER